MVYGLGEKKTPSLELCLLMDSELPASLLVNAALLWLLAQPPLLSLALRRAFHTVLFKHRTQATLSFSAARQERFCVPCPPSARHAVLQPRAELRLRVDQAQRGRAAAPPAAHSLGSLLAWPPCAEIRAVRAIAVPSGGTGTVEAGPV